MKYFGKLSLAVVALLCGGFLVGCTTYAPHSVSMPGTVDADVDAIARVEGVSRSHYFLFFGPFGDDSLKAATADALSKKGGNAIVNVTVDRARIDFPPKYPLIYRSIVTTISGTAVRVK